MQIVALAKNKLGLSASVTLPNQATASCEEGERSAARTKEQSKSRGR